jgi:hypothetical protein
MLDERARLYQRLAAVTVETDDLDPTELADEIAAQIAEGIAHGQSGGDPQ